MNDRPTSEQDDDVIIGDRSQSTVQQRSAQDTTSGDVETTRSGSVSDVRDSGGFLPDERMEAFRDRWDDVQAAFVDDPRNAVQRAQQLVDDLVKELTDVFAGERSDLEGQWSGGGQADTEQLRVALQRYRDFFNRLLGT